MFPDHGRIDPGGTEERVPRIPRRGVRPREDRPPVHGRGGRRRRPLGIVHPAPVRDYRREPLPGVAGGGPPGRGRHPPPPPKAPPPPPLPFESRLSPPPPPPPPPLRHASFFRPPAPPPPPPRPSTPRGAPVNS